MTQHYSGERRNFLKTIALFSGAAASLSLTRKAVAEGKPDLLPEKPVQGYRETAHIKKYYKTAGN